MDKRHEGTFHKRRYADKSEKRKDIHSLAMFEIKPQKYNCLPVGMIKMKNSSNTEYWLGYRESGLLIHCWCECKMV